MTTDSRQETSVDIRDHKPCAAGPDFRPGAATPLRLCFALCLLLALAGSACRPPEPPETGADRPVARVETCRDLILLFDEAETEHDGPADDDSRIELRDVAMSGTERPAIFAHPVSEISWRLRINPGAKLTFRIGLHPDSWATNGDGVTFEVLVRGLVGRTTIFSRHIDPAHHPEHQGWTNCSVDLGEYAGETREITLRTDPGPAGDPAYDWALWGDPQLMSDGRRVAPDDAGRPHVFLVSLDTLRLDHLDACGHDRLTAPHLNRLLEESVFFTAAQAPSHWTMPSHMSVFTSLTPDVHQVARTDGTARLADGIPTLAGRMKVAGYRTAGFATCGFLKGVMGFDRGFDLYCLRHNTGRRQNRLFRDWAWENRGEEMFIFLHYFDIHSDYRTLPYEAHLGFETLWSELEPESVFDGCSPDGALCASTYLTSLNRENTQLGADAREAISVMYDRGIRQLDHELARLVSWLKSAGLWESSLVVFFSDHGEEFQEHGKLLHMQLYNELTGVPLIVKLPGGKHGGRRIDTPVEILDTAPTILSLLGLPVPEQMQGGSLVPLIEAEGDVSPGEPLPLTSWSSEGSSITRGDWKLVAGRHSDREQLFNLAEDPGERQNLIHLEPEIARELLELLEERLRRNSELVKRIGSPDTPAEEGFSEEERKRLELLGYVE